MESYNAPKHQIEALDEALEIKMLKAIQNNPKIKQIETAISLGVSIATIED